MDKYSQSTFFACVYGCTNSFSTAHLVYNCTLKGRGYSRQKERKYLTTHPECSRSSTDNSIKQLAAKCETAVTAVRQRWQLCRWKWNVNSYKSTPSCELVSFMSQIDSSICKTYNTEVSCTHTQKISHRQLGPLRGSSSCRFQSPATSETNLGFLERELGIS